MSKLPSEITNRLSNLLLKCDQFNSDLELQAFFRTNRQISLWANKVRDATNRENRVNFTIDLLQNRQNCDGKNALVLLLYTLKDKADNDDAICEELEELASELEEWWERHTSAGKGHKPITETEEGLTPTMKPTQSPESEAVKPLESDPAFSTFVRRAKDIPDKLKQTLLNEYNRTQRKWLIWGLGALALIVFCGLLWLFGTFDSVLTPLTKTTNTATLTLTPTTTPTLTRSPTLTPTPSLTPTPRATATPKSTLTPTRTSTPTPTRTATPTAKPTLPPSPTHTPSPTNTQPPPPASTLPPPTSTPLEASTEIPTVTPADPGPADPPPPTVTEAPPL